MIRLIDDKLLDELGDQARSSPRRRKNLNFHDSDHAPAHRLLNAVEPDSYVAPHRHLDPAKDETFMVLRGRFGLVLFDNDGHVTHKYLLEAAGNVVGVDIPHGTWHSVVSLRSGSIFFEAKAGPYLPFSAEEKAPWAPGENDIGAKNYLAHLQSLFADKVS